MSKLLKLTIVSASLLFGSAIVAADNNQTTTTQTEMSTPADQSTTATADVEKATPAAALVNINEADAKTLMTVKGINSKTAKAIVDYRTKNGNFKTVDDLTKVKEVSKSLFKKISSQLTV